jgi:hypothetical protein
VRRSEGLFAMVISVKQSQLSRSRMSCE